VLLATIAIIGSSMGVAQAGDPTCASYSSTGVCLVPVTGPGAPGGPGGPGGGGGGGSDSDPTINFITINGASCLPAGRSNPQPLASDPIWGGHTDGAIFDCVVAPKVGPGGLVGTGVTLQYWALDAPPPPPDPAVLARQAIETMQLRAVGVGVAPESRPGSVGLVGMPNWMWVADPGPQTVGPITKIARAGPWSVTATASVARVSWDMGDGQVIACGAGTAYQPSFGRSASPDCGHVYTRQGSYTVQATSHWVVTWSGIGRVGTITLDLSQSAPVVIGEAQVIRQ
jgi:hypothetical protein